MPALAALPDLALAAAGVLLILLAYALYLLRDLITSGFSRVPLIGGWVASHLGSALDSAGHAVMHGADSAFHGAEAVFRVAETWVLQVLNVITWAGRSVGDALANIAYVQVPGAYRAAARDTAVALAAARAYTGWLWGHLGHEISAGLHAATALAWRLYGQLRADVATALADARGFTGWLWGWTQRHIALALADARAYTGWLWGWTGREITAAEARLRAGAVYLHNTAEADIARGLAASAAATETAIAATAKGIYTDLETWGDKAVHVAWPDAEGGLEALRRALGSAWPDIAKSLPYLEGLGTAGLLGALIRSMAGVNVLTKVMTDCVVPNCDNLGKLGRELSQLESAGAVAAILAWLAYTAADPVAAANDTVTVADPLTDKVFGPLVALISAGAEHL